MSKHFLVVDNGSYKIKVGLESQRQPIKIQNTLVKAKDSNIYVGDEYTKHTNNYSGLVFKRPHDQGHLVSWETEKPIWDYAMSLVEPGQDIDCGETHLILTETPFQLPQLSMNTDQIVFEEYGFSEYYRCTAGSLMPWMGPKNCDFALVIDSGYTCTWIMPVLYQKVYWKGVRKLPVGGAMLNGLLRELISYRHYDVSDETVLVNTVKHSTCFVAEDYLKTLKEKRKYVSEFILPDFKTTITGYVKTAGSKVSDDAQSLKLSDERFTVPEAFFHPDIIFDSTLVNPLVIHNVSFKNIVDLIVESIMACPEVAQPLLLANIIPVGGNTLLPGFLSRLKSELRKEVPLEWLVNLQDLSVSRDEAAWFGGAGLATNEIINQISISKKEYFEHGSNWCQKQFGFKNR